MQLTRLRSDVLNLADEAVGRGHRHDPVSEPTGGPAGNARLTAWTGLALLALLAVEMITLLDIHQLISWHVAVGVLLIPPALLKTASTGWRILRYYTGHRSYRIAGPPPMLLRLLGPLVVLSTLGVLGSGLLLILLGEQNSRTALFSLLGQRIDWLTIHQGFFVVFLVVTGVHVLARTVPALGLATRWVRRRTGAPERVPGSVPRAAVLALTLAVAAVSTALLLPKAGSWNHGFDRFAHFGHEQGFDR